jgi:hypothetical protein
MNIELQIQDLQRLFNTKNIFDKTSRAYLSHDQLDGIINIIRTNKTDGAYEMGELTVILNQGKVEITDNKDYI